MKARIAALAVGLALLAMPGSSHAAGLRVVVDKAPADCSPGRCVQLRTITYRQHHHVLLQVTQVRHRPTEARNAPPFMAAWRAWHVLAAGQVT